MTDQLLTSLGNEMQELVRPVLSAADDPAALARLAWRARWTVPEFHTLDTNALSNAVTSLETAVGLVADGELTADSLAAVVTGLETVGDIFTAVTAATEVVSDVFNDPASPSIATDFLADMAEVLILDWLSRRAPQLYQALELLTIVGPEIPSEITIGPASAGTTLRVAMTRDAFHFDRLGPLLFDPLGHLRGVYLEGGQFLGQPDAEVLINRLFPQLARLAVQMEGGGLISAAGTRAVHLLPTAPTDVQKRTAILTVPMPSGNSLLLPQLDAVIEVVPPGVTSTGNQAGPGLEVTPTGVIDLDTTSGLWTVTFDVSGTPGRFFINADGVSGAGAGLGVDLHLIRGLAGQPAMVIGGDAGTRLTIGRLCIDGFLTAAASGPDYGIGIAAEDARLEIAAGDGDGFLSSVLPPDGIGVDFDLALAWSRLGGLQLGGSVGLAITIPTSINIAGIAIDEFELTLAAAGGGLSFTAGLSAGIDLGVFQAVVEGLGLTMDLTPAATVPGNLGPFDAGLRFQPPRGIGISIDAGVATGGGYLFADHPNHTYGGVLDIDVLAVGISAVGVVNTEPVDVDGWSMLFALFIDLPSIPLGFGFTLNGVGGLAGVNRTIDADALTSVVRSGSMDAILFPPDPVADGPEIIEQLQSVFPPADGSYVFGPIAKIGWGTPTIVEASIGVAISLPDPVVIAVLGSVSAVLPNPDLELAAINLDVAGIVDFGQSSLSIDASLHDSHIVGFALSGDMSLRAEFGDRPSFLFALGGFHPAFDPPPGFPAMNRLSLSLNGGPLLQLSFESYLAITSNTVQFGAAFEIWAKIAGFGIEGGTEFDAMVQFNPFELTTSLGFHIAITAIGIDLVGVWLDATVTGPNPWTIVGSARFKVLGLEEEIHVDETIGSREQEPTIPRANLFDELVQALSDDDAWEAISTGAGAVVLADRTDRPATSAPSELFANPDGRVAVTQRAVPLGVVVDKAGNALAGDQNSFVLEGVGLDQTGTTSDWFAPAYFFDMGSTERLSAPSFEQLSAGLEFGGGDAEAGPDRRGNLRHEQILRDPEGKEDRVKLGGFTFSNDKRDGVTTLATQSAEGFTIAGNGQSIELTDPEYAVADRATGEVVTTASSWSAARHVSAGRDQANAVVPEWEAAGQ
ncbi:MAG: DUF6603 domain-containing protein [Actinomycetota bacterium]